MVNYEKGVELFFLDGTTSGRWVADFTAWDSFDCTGYRISKADLSKCDVMDELRRPGIVFTFGQSKSNKSVVYIDGAMDLLNEIKALELPTPYLFAWNEVVLITNRNNTFSEKQLMYLLAQFCKQAIGLTHCEMVNDYIPSQPILPRDSRSALDEFISNACFVLAALGHNVYQKSARQNKPPVTTLFLKFKDIQASGHYLKSGEFLVLEGSKMYGLETPSCSSGIHSRRSKLVSDGVVRNGTFTKNCVFPSPSTAASCICGASENGNDMWLTKDGVKLGVLREQKKI